MAMCAVLLSVVVNNIEHVKHGSNNEIVHAKPKSKKRICSARWKWMIEELWRFF